MQNLPDFKFACWEVWCVYVYVAILLPRFLLYFYYSEGREWWNEGCSRMFGTELDGRISIVVDVGRYIIGGATTTMGRYGYVWVFMGMFGYVLVW